MRAFWLERGWYLALWVLWPIVVLLLARLALVNPLIRSNQESAGRIVRAMQLRGERE